MCYTVSIGETKVETIKLIILILILPVCWTFEMSCNPSKIDKQGQTIAIEALKIHYKSEAEATRYLRNSVRKNSVFPWHKISFSGDLIDSQNQMITELGHNEIENTIKSFNNQRVLRFQNNANKSLDTFSCKMTFQHSDRAPKSSNLPYEVYVAIVEKAEACIEDYMCKYSLSYEQTKAKMTEAKTINAIVDFGVGNIQKMISNNNTIPAPIENLGFSMSSITFKDDTVISKVNELSIKSTDQNNLIVKGFYDLTTNFSLNDVSAMLVFQADHLPVRVTNLQVAFELVLKLSQDSCNFALTELKIFNLANATDIDFSGQKDEQKEKSEWGMRELLSWGLGTGLNVISSTNFLKVKEVIYSTLMVFVEGEIKKAVENFNWETYVSRIVDETRESFEKLYSEVQSQQKAIQV